MRECWINVSVIGRGSGKQEAVLGCLWSERRMAVAAEREAQYRLHVRLKPEASR